MIELVASYVLPAAFRVLGDKYDSPEARAMLLAIGLQESRFLHRAQVQGPARGFWQFEKGGGVVGVLTHQHSTIQAYQSMATLRCISPGEQLKDTKTRIYAALEHNDVLAAVFARLLLWTLPAALPGRSEPGAAWGQYIEAWRPGAPHRGTWDAFYAEAWGRVDAGDHTRR